MNIIVFIIGHSFYLNTIEIIFFHIVPENPILLQDLSYSSSY